jgi:hypothetical protein
VQFVEKDVRQMATKSITKDIRIKDPALGRAFVNALENCSGKFTQEVSISGKVREVKSVDEARRIFAKQ